MSYLAGVNAQCVTTRGRSSYSSVAHKHIRTIAVTSSNSTPHRTIQRKSSRTAESTTIEPSRRGFPQTRATREARTHVPLR
eukprot:195603-Prorocentrum_minimum.AAC.1